MTFSSVLIICGIVALLVVFIKALNKSNDEPAANKTLRLKGGKMPISERSTPSQIANRLGKRVPRRYYPDRMHHWQSWFFASILTAGSRREFYIDDWEEDWDEDTPFHDADYFQVKREENGYQVSVYDSNDLLTQNFFVSQSSDSVVLELDYGTYTFDSEGVTFKDEEGSISWESIDGWSEQDTSGKTIWSESETYDSSAANSESETLEAGNSEYLEDQENTDESSSEENSSEEPSGDSSFTSTDDGTAY
ncbi:MAG: hypothetical protein AAF518_24255 [Spirochaetota bacterium]